MYEEYENTLVVVEFVSNSEIYTSVQTHLPQTLGRDSNLPLGPINDSTPRQRSRNEQLGFLPLFSPVFVPSTGVGAETSQRRQAPKCTPGNTKTSQQQRAEHTQPDRDCFLQTPRLAAPPPLTSKPEPIKLNTRHGPRYIYLPNAFTTNADKPHCRTIKMLIFPCTYLHHASSYRTLWR